MVTGADRPGMRGVGVSKVDFFVSYTAADEAWATWIGVQLEAAGQRVRLQAWDSPAGMNFVVWVSRQMQAASHTIAVCSKTYFDSHWCTQEWTGALADKKVIPLRVADCIMPSVLATTSWRDLYGLDEAAARRQLLEAVGLAAVARVASGGFPGGAEAPLTGLRGVARRQVMAGHKIFELPVARRNEHFTGRGNLLARLGVMKAGSLTAVLQAVTGLGGIGKTELVVEYAYRHQEDYDLVYTLRADTEAVLLEDMRGLARIVGLSQSRDGLTARVHRWLRSRRGWLLIFDNADSLPGLAEYLPDGPGHVVITSRDAVWRQRAAVVEVDVWEPAESVEFLRSRLTASLASDGAGQVAELLGHFPLALEQAAGYMEANGVTCTAYARLYRERSGDLLDAYAPTALGYDQTVAATWIVTFEAVQRSQPQALELLRLCAYLAPDALPESIFTRGSSALPASLQAVVADPMAFNAALGELNRYRLVRRTGDGMLSMHRLVQHVVRTEARQAARDLAAASVRLVSSVFSEKESDDHPADGESGSPASVLFPHAIAAAAHAAAMDSEPDLLTGLLTRAGEYVGRRARLAGTEATVADAVAITSQVYGNDTPEMAQSLTTLGRLLLAKDGLAAARACFERALAVTESVHGAGSSQAVDLRNELADTLVRQDDIAGAQAYLRGTGYLDDLGVDNGGAGGRPSQID